VRLSSHNVGATNERPSSALTHPMTLVPSGQVGTWMYTGGDDQTVRVFDLRASPDYRFSFDHGSAVTCIALHPNQASPRCH
jgi:WD40 repeat protein